ncbi:hypothetical protein AYO22_04609 [Fonsecaea multimorphosa]|nr:hypothetical protein AYO22_04609 [Fonsecaea multimorphosa]
MDTGRGIWRTYSGPAYQQKNVDSWSEREMVKPYVTELARAGGPTISEEEARAELKRQTFGALWYWAFTLTLSKIMPDMQSEETTLHFIGRITSLMDDHNALDSFQGI